MTTDTVSALAVDKTAPHINLSDRTMNVSLHLSAWGGQRLDRKTTAEVLAERKASDDAGRFEKYLVPPTALDPVNRAHSKARRRHYRLTLPWGDEGVRILSSAAFFEYTEALNEEKRACERAYQEFLGAYPRYVDEAPKRLGPLFSPSDFPAVETLKDKFRFRMVLLPVPDKQDFRVQLGDELQEQIRQDIEETVMERYAAAQRELWTRLFDAVKHFAVTMEKPDPVFRESTVTNLGDLARLAPKLTLTPDARLNEICADIVSLADTVDVQSLRDSVALRRDAAGRARTAVRAIEDKLKELPNGR